MGIFNNLLGNASELNNNDLQAELAPVLFEGEQVDAGFKVFRDKWVFTNRRLIMINVQGLSGNKKEFHSLPYKSITQFLVESAGTFDMDAEIKIWVSGQAAPYQKELSKGVDTVGLQKKLAQYVCK